MDARVTAARRPRGWNGLPIVAAGLLLASGCARPEPAPPPPAQPPPAQTAPAAEAPAEPAPTGYLGVLVPAQETDLSSELEGRLSEVRVRVGESVERGELLARIEPTGLDAELGQARAALTAAGQAAQQAEIELAQAQEKRDRLERAPDLFSAEARSAAKAAAERAERGLEAARALVAQREAELAGVDQRSRRREILAPLAGRVTARYLDAGARVEPGTAVLRLAGSGQRLVRFAVPPEEITRLQVGQAVRILLPAGGELPARVARIAPQVDPPSQMVFVEAELQAGPSPPSLPDGLTVRVSPVQNPPTP